MTFGLLAAAFALLLGGCATVDGGRAPDEGASAALRADGNSGASTDPLEGFNRAMYRFNEVFDDYVLKPVAKGYRAALPSPVRAGISNFFSNLREPIVIVNDVLQGKFGQAIWDTGRFVVNTTIGLFGVLDPATHMQLARHNEDFGQTLGYWGVGEGLYVVWPFLGPSTLRDTGGFVADWQIWPPTHMENEGRRNTLIVTEIVDTRSQLLDATDILEQAAGQDPYIFVREAFRQSRKNLIYDGNPPKSVPKELFEDEPPPAKPAGN